MYSGTIKLCFLLCVLSMIGCHMALEKQGPYPLIDTFEYEDKYVSLSGPTPTDQCKAHCMAIEKCQAFDVLMKKILDSSDPSKVLLMCSYYETIPGEDDYTSRTNIDPYNTYIKVCEIAGKKVYILYI